MDREGDGWAVRILTLKLKKNCFDHVCLWFLSILTDLDDGIDYRTVIKENIFTMWYKTSLHGEFATLNCVITPKDQNLLQHIFDEDIQTSEAPQTVVLQGAAGIGKTTLLKKAVLEWADGNLYQQFTHVFYLNGKEISQVKEKSFAQLISKHWPSSEGPIEQGQVEKGGRVEETCKTSTALFTYYICSLFPRIPVGCVTLPNETLLRSLCKAAVEGIWTMKHVLYQQNLRKHELTREDILLFLDAKVLQQDTEYENCYMFTHLHVQEFFAALFYLLRENLEEQDYPSEPFENLYLLLESNHIHDPHLEQMKCFLFGLLNKDRVRQLEETFNLTISMEVREELLACLEGLEKDDSSLSQLRFQDLLHCIYETQDQEFITQALMYFQKIIVRVDEEPQLRIYSFCLKHCHTLKTMRLTARADLKNMLDTAEMCLEGAAVQVIHYWQDLFSVLHTNESLIEMDLYESRLDESLMKILNEELSHPKCKLQKLIFRSVDFLNGCQDFTFLASNKKVTHLDLKETDLGVNGLKTLCEALKCKGCKLRVLRLASCDLNVARCQKLSNALQTNRSLVFLNLSLNNLSNDGVKSLCEVLENPNSSLERLALMSCVLTSKACGDLASVLVNNSNLWSLDLGHNILDDAGLNILCDALRNPNCHVQRLG
uniref:RNI-like protein n=1 Tax=Mus musculus TaxID=10090 RepID=Q9EPG7_MOUSE|nr:RNI-like protein [Mus musculus]